ncbi:MAG: hypothetical protein AAF653_13260 [Chloroflexota bacterium]
MMRLTTLYPKAPYNLRRSAELLSRYHGVLENYENGAYLRAMVVDGQVVLFRVESNDNLEAPELSITHLAGPLHDPEQAIAKMRWLLAADYDLTGFYDMAKQHPRLWNVIEPLYGVRHFQGETVFEALMTVIIEQQISLYAALKAQRALAEWGGRQVEYDGKPYYTFPTPQQIAHATHDELHAILKITHRRVDVMQGIASNVLDGKLDLEGMRTLPAASVYEQLTAIKWVGHWTAAWTLIRGLNCYDYVGHNDVALRSAVSYYFHDMEERVSADEVTHTFDAYAPYSGLAAFYTLMRWAVDRY